MSRSWPVPDHWDRTLHLVGDTHAGSIPASRLTIVANDLQAHVGKTLPLPAHRVFLGDCVDNGLTSEDTTFKTFANGLLDAPWHTVMGNHDIFQDVRLASAWATSLGMPGSNYTVDFGFAQGIFVAPDAMGYPPNFAQIRLSNTTLTWMKAAHDAYAGDSLIFCLAPLHNTVGDDGTGTVNLSTDANIFAVNASGDADSSAITAVLGTMPRAKAWISGHSHSPLDAANIVKQLTMSDGHKMAAINTSCIWYTKKTGYSFDGAICTMYMTYLGSSIEVRFRNHGAGVWVTASQQRVQTVALT